MFGSMLTKVFGSRNQRLIKRMGRTVAQVNALEASMTALSDEELAAKEGSAREEHVEILIPPDVFQRDSAPVQATEQRICHHPRLSPV